MGVPAVVVPLSGPGISQLQLEVPAFGVTAAIQLMEATPELIISVEVAGTVTPNSYKAHRAARNRERTDLESDRDVDRRHIQAELGRGVGQAAAIRAGRQRAAVTVPVEVAAGGTAVVVPLVQANQLPPTGKATDGVQVKGTDTGPALESAWMVSLKMAGAAPVGRLTTCEVGEAVREPVAT